ncbi:MAG TPA: carboxypeptidase regulatory-like domain-containing protein [Candidatus Acidoferrales bacterium]|nr:carboxypeptidase regulatory-like domain-containing protein [Candidatus Acidoferrales bacterium]
MFTARRISHAIARKIEQCFVFLTILIALGAFSFAQQTPQKSTPPAQKSPMKSAISPSGTGAADTAAEKLPLRRVVLYKSGVGYFEHGGRVHGNEDVEIDLTSSQLDDVLKSLTALDLSGGRIVGASYNSQEPAGHQLESLPVPVADNTTLGSLLEELRGARLEIRTAGGAFTGRLLSVEEKTHRDGYVEVKQNQISLLNDSGDVRSFNLEPGTSVRLADRDLEQELARALGLLDASHQEDMRRLVLSTAGTGDRQIRVSYISEVPIWKTTYRIVLPSASFSAGTKPLLQGWAVVDNTVGEDWKDIELSLAAGAPQTFIQQLSQPYYTQRPVVPLPQNVLLSPQTHGATLFSGGGRVVGVVKDSSGATVAGATAKVFDSNNNQVAQTETDDNGHYSFTDLAPGNYNLEISMTGFKSLRLNSVPVVSGRTYSSVNGLEVGSVSMTVSVEAGGVPALETQNATVSESMSARAIRNLTSRNRSRESRNATFDGTSNQEKGLNSANGFFGVNGSGIGNTEEFGITGNSENVFLATSRSVDAAQGALLGDLFEYKLKDRVTIRKNQSALVPIVQTEISAEKVALWNPGLGMARPLRALWLTNTSPLVLDGGSFNVIEDGAFAGEGLIASLHPGEKRLISYAADLAMQVVARQEPTPETLTHIHVAHGILIRTVASRTRVTYTIRNEDTTARTLILEHPVRPKWKLASGVKPDEESAAAYRFRVEVPSKETKTFTVEETTPVSTQIQINSLNLDTLEIMIKRRDVPPELDQSLRQIIAQRAAVAKLDADLEEKNDSIDSIADDQDRLRENLKALKGSAEEKTLAQRYIAELDNQETQLATFKKQIADLEARRKEAQEQLDKAIAELEFDADMKSAT